MLVTALLAHECIRVSGAMSFLAVPLQRVNANHNCEAKSEAHHGFLLGRELQF